MFSVFLSLCFSLNGVFLAENTLAESNLLPVKSIEISQEINKEGLVETEYQQLELILAEIALLEDKGEFQEAINYIKNLNKKWEKNLKLKLKLADLKLTEKQFEKALNIYKAIGQGNNFSQEKSYALRNYKKLLEEKIKNADYEAYLPLMLILKKEWRNKEALHFIRQALNNEAVSEEIKLKLKNEATIFNLRLGEYEKAILGFEDYNNINGWRWLSQTYNRKGDFKKAAQYRIKIFEKVKSQKDLFLAFEILAKGGLFEEAKALTEKYKSLKNIKATWLLGLSSFLSKDYNESLKYFEAIIKLSESGKAQAEYYKGALYYKARILEKLNKNKEAREIYLNLSKMPTNYYQILALSKVADNFKSEKDLIEEFSSLLQSANKKDYESKGYNLWLASKVDLKLDVNTITIKSLKNYLNAENKKFINEYKSKKAIYAFALLGDWPKAYQELAFHKEELLKPSFLASLSKEEALIFKKLAVKLSARNQNYRLAVRFLSQLKDLKPRDDKLATWSYPLVYGPNALKAYKQYNLSPQLLLSLIRTESAFQDDVVSVSNARGLMQVLPSTGLQIAENLEHPTYNEMDLFEAGFGIDYGSWYLAILIEAFQDSALALAAYNGGPFNIKSLVLAKPNQPLDIFIETLVFKENINYVKKIVEVQYTYEKLYLSGFTKRDFTKKIKPPKSNLPEF